MKVSLLLGTLAAALSATVVTNALTILPARAIVTGGLAMTPARCRQLALRDHRVCDHGRLVKAPARVYRVHMTLALKKLDYQKASDPKARESVPAP
jgi:hypothetical protein